MAKFLAAVFFLWATAALAQDAETAFAQGNTIDPIELAPGRSTILRTERPFRTVSTSNPDAVDVNHIGQDNAVILLGRGIGTSDLIILDAQGNVLVQTQVVVRGANHIVIRRPGQRVIGSPTGDVNAMNAYTCNPICRLIGSQSTPSVGPNLIEIQQPPANEIVIPVGPRNRFNSGEGSPTPEQQ